MKNKLDYQSNINYASSEVNYEYFTLSIPRKRKNNEMLKQIGKRTGRMHSDILK